MAERNKYLNSITDHSDQPLRLIVPYWGHQEQGDSVCSAFDLTVAADQFIKCGYGADVSLLYAVYAGLADDAYDVGEHMFRWLNGASRRLSLTTDYERHAISISLEPGREGGEESAEVSALEQLVCQYCRDEQRSERLKAFIEGCVLAIIRVFGREGRFAAADTLLAEAAPILPYSIHLQAAQYTVTRKLRGIGVAPHLEKFVGGDSGVLAGQFCEVPFGRMDIDGDGDVRVCCTHWVPTVIGNVFQSGAEEIMNSDMVQNIRRSVVDGTFKYCNHVDCELMANGKLRRKSDYSGVGLSNDFYDISAERLDAALHRGDYRVDNISHVIYALDRTCNLSCPSCRSEIVSMTGVERDRALATTETTVIPLLRKAKRLMINTVGEPFVSLPCRRLLASLNLRDFPRLKVDIITNGTVCTKDMWEKFRNLEGMIGIIRVSVDAATQETFEKLRRGADYGSFITNMINLSKMHRQGFVDQFHISFTYQLDNYLEMEKFVAFGRWLGVDAVVFECLHNLGAFTSEEYCRKSVHLATHPEFPIFREIAARLKSDRTIYMDFDPGEEEQPLPLSEKLMRGLFSRFSLDLDLVMHTAAAARIDPAASFTADVPLASDREEELYLVDRMSLAGNELFLQKKLIQLESALLVGLMVVGGLPKSSLSLSHVDLGKGNFFGLGWGRPGSNVSGQAWRWLFGGQAGRSSVYGRVAPGCTYEVRLQIHEVHIEQYLQSLRLVVQDKPVQEQYVKKEDGSTFHVAILPQHTVGLMKGWLGLTYTTEAPAKSSPGEEGVSATALEVRPLA